MERKHLPIRLGTTAEALEFAASELCEVASDAHKGKVNNDALFDRLLALSSVVSLSAGQVRDAEGVSRLSDEEEIGQALGQVFFPQLMGLGEKEEESKAEDQAEE